MTFSQNVKQEILKSVTSLPDCCKRAFVSGCIKGSGSLELLHGKMSGIVESESAELIETIAELVSRLYGEGKDITESNRQLSVKPIYQYRVSAKALVECDFVNINAEGLYSLNDGIAKKLLRSECCKRSYLKGLFCSCGYVIMPEKLDSLDSASISAHYHLELSLNSVEACEQVYKLLLAFKIPSKVALRKSGAIVYLKGSEEIADLLVVFGAYTAKMELENVKIERQMRNDANRQTNCISANIDKAVATAFSQIEAIEQLQKRGTLQLLDEKLKTIAMARLNNPEATLAELAEEVGLSKSGARHRLNKLMEILQETKE